MTRNRRTTDHGNQDHAEHVARVVVRGQCSCGWRGDVCDSVLDAVADANDHMLEDRVEASLNATPLRFLFAFILGAIFGGVLMTIATGAALFFLGRA